MIDYDKTWACGCASDNTKLTAQCDEHNGPVSTAINLRGTDPRLNVVHAPSVVVLHFTDSQGNPSRMSGRVSRKALLKIMAAIGENDVDDMDEEELAEYLLKDL